MGDRITQVFQADLSQCIRERLSIACCLRRIGIRLVFKLTRKQMAQRADPKSDSAQNEEKDHECNGHGSLSKSKCGEEPGLFGDPGDDPQLNKHASQAYSHHQKHMTFLEVTNFMREHRFHFSFVQLFNKGVEQDDTSKFPKASKKSVGVA